MLCGCCKVVGVVNEFGLGFFGWVFYCLVFVVMCLIVLMNVCFSGLLRLVYVRLMLL